MKALFPVVSSTTGEVYSQHLDIAEAREKATDTNYKNAIVLGSKDDILQMKLVAITNVYNRLTGKSIKMLESKEKGANQLLKFLQPTASNVKSKSTQEGNTMATAKKKSTPRKSASPKRKTATTKKAANPKARVKAKSKAAATKKKAAAPTTTTPKTGRKTYRDKLDELFSKKTTKKTLAEIAKALDTDERNTLTAMSIAKNPNRTPKDKLVVLERDSDGFYKLAK